jgi:hypothetical protein
VTISIINESTAVADTDVEAWVSALQTQVNEHFGPIWGMASDLRFLTSAEASQAANDWQLVVLDNSDQAGALGYHDMTAAGLPLGKVFAADDLKDNSSVSVTVSHELLEMLGDPTISSCIVQTDANGNVTGLLAYEACDAVEDDQYGYEINGVLVSDFIFPSWFGGIEATKFDYQGHCAQAGEILSGGYTAKWTPSGWTQINGQKAAGSRHAHAPEGSRRERRARGRRAWQRSQPR